MDSRPGVIGAVDPPDLDPTHVEVAYDAPFERGWDSSVISARFGAVFRI